MKQMETNLAPGEKPNEDLVKPVVKETQREQAPTQEQAEPTLNLTLEVKEVLKLLTIIESAEEFKLANMLETETTLVLMHRAMYDWFVNIQKK